MAGTRVFPNALELRRAAARESLSRIERDHARSPEKLQPLLEHIRDHLFSPGLNVQSLKRACGIRDNSMSTVFGRVIGLPPRPYMEARRLETAEGLLSETALPVSQISELVGFSSEAVFYRAFRRWRGIAPSSFRAEVFAQREPLAVECMRDEDVRRALRGRASRDETEALIAGLSTASEVVADASSVAASASDDPAPGRDPIESIWNEMRTRNHAAQCACIAKLGTQRMGLAELLFERSRTEARDDRRSGVTIAGLAVECLANDDGRLDHVDPVTLDTLRTRALTWLANAHRLALDFGEAEKAVTNAKRMLPASAPDEVRAELLEIEGGLRCFQGRFDEAYGLLGHSLDLIEDGARPQRIARVVAQQATQLLLMDDLQAASQRLRDVITLLVRDPDDYLLASMYQRLMSVYVHLDQFQDASVLMPASRLFTDRVDLEVVRCHQRWIEASVWSGLGDLDLAETQFESAVEGFIGLGDRLYAAMTLVDLAILCCENGQEARALRACAQAVPLFESIDARREALAAARVLREIVAREHARSETLRGLRSKLQQAEHRPPSAPRDSI